ncbi:hypothetical protein [Klebsiella pneumoniae]|uniref:hypothetical protein n=1 Tax=Klebsiella pneumoniae TaxID=573 RepID=UPI001034A289|nr:hypothetical protein [Klebsiella pneumoniae]MDE4668573.1 hypothetical protein [Klebsiella pneumoniae]
MEIKIKDQIELKGDVKDLEVFLESRGHSLSEYLKPDEVVNKWCILAPLIIYIIINFLYIIFHGNVHFIDPVALVTMFMFSSALLAILVAYFIYQKKKESLAWSALVILIILAGTNAGYLTYKDIAVQASEKAKTYIK